MDKHLESIIRSLTTARQVKEISNVRFEECCYWLQDIISAAVYGNWVVETQENRETYQHMSAEELQEATRKFMESQMEVIWGMEYNKEIQE